VKLIQSIRISWQGRKDAKKYSGLKDFTRTHALITAQAGAQAGQHRVNQWLIQSLDPLLVGNERIAVQIVAYAVGESSMGVGITDSVFIQDQNRHGRSILDRHNGDARAVERLRKALAKNGYALKSDDHYISTAAQKFGDPAAIVNHTTGLGGLKQRLEARNQHMEGEVNIKPRENGIERKVKHRLNPAIVERIRQRKIKENPDLARKDQRELREQIIDQHGLKTKS
jgi:hypothetical protein